MRISRIMMLAGAALVAMLVTGAGRCDPSAGARHDRDEHRLQLVPLLG